MGFETSGPEGCNKILPQGVRTLSQPLPTLHTSHDSATPLPKHPCSQHLLSLLLALWSNAEGLEGKCGQMGPPSTSTVAVSNLFHSPTTTRGMLALDELTPGQLQLVPHLGETSTSEEVLLGFMNW